MALTSAFTQRKQHRRCEGLTEEAVIILTFIKAMQMTSKRKSDSGSMHGATTYFILSYSKKTKVTDKVVMLLAWQKEKAIKNLQSLNFESVSQHLNVIFLWQMYF